MPAISSSVKSIAKISRHEFLDLSWKTILGISGLLGITGILRFLSYAPQDPAPSQYDLGDPSTYPENSETPIPEAHAMLFHDPQGFHALSIICPHLGCEVQKSVSGFRCPCHGSQFDQRGIVTHGPAKTNLQRLEITVDERKHLILHT